MKEIEPTEDLIGAFKEALADLVDGLLALADQPSVDAMHEALAADQATLRLEVNVAPVLSLVLSVIMHETPPRPVVIARYGAEPPAVEVDRATLN